MDRSDPSQLPEFGAYITSELHTLASHYSNDCFQESYSHAFFLCVTSCMDCCFEYSTTLDSVFQQSRVSAGCPSAADICKMVVKQGLDQALLVLIEALQPFVSMIDITDRGVGVEVVAKVSRGGGRTCRTPQAASATVGATRNRGGLSLLDWEFRKDLQASLSAVSRLISALSHAVVCAGPAAEPAYQLARQLLHGDQILQTLGAAGKRMTLHLFHTHVLHEQPIHKISAHLPLDLSKASMDILDLITTLPVSEQLPHFKWLPVDYVEMLCRNAYCSHDPALPTSKATLLRIALLSAPAREGSLIPAACYAERHSPALAKSLLAQLHCPSMQRITHLVLTTLIPITAVGPIATCEKDLAHNVNSSSPPSHIKQKQHDLHTIFLLLDGMLLRLDREHADQALLNSGSSELRVRLQWANAAAVSDTSTGISSQHPQSAVHDKLNSRDTYLRVWGCVTKEEWNLLLPQATSLGALLAEIVRIGVWSLPELGPLCCKLAGFLLRACEGETSNTRMRSELGGVMLVVTRLASEVATLVLDQQSAIEVEDNVRKNTDSLLGSLLSKYAKDCEPGPMFSEAFRANHAETAASLQLLVMQMLRVGKFCDDGTLWVTGVYRVLRLCLATVGVWSKRMGGWAVLCKGS